MKAMYVLIKYPYIEWEILKPRGAQSVARGPNVFLIALRLLVDLVHIFRDGILLQILHD